MTEHNLQYIIDELDNKHKKRDWVKIYVSLFGFVGIMLSIGFVGGDWYAWRRVTTDDVRDIKVWKNNFANLTHEGRAAKLNSIHIKNGEQ